MVEVGSTEAEVSSKVFLVLSPHFDDAVLSVGAWLSRHPGALVATAFSGLPGPGVPAQNWDKHSQFSTGDEANLARRAEDEAALAVLNATQRTLGFLDGDYKGITRRYHESKNAHPTITEALAEAVIQLLAELQPDRLLFPVGWPQPDHSVTSEAALIATQQTGTPAIAYAELPYAVGSSAYLSERITELRGRGLSIVGYPVPTGDLDLKQRAWDCYHSQQIHLGKRPVGCFDADSEHLFRVR